MLIQTVTFFGTLILFMHFSHKYKILKEKKNNKHLNPKVIENTSSTFLLQKVQWFIFPSLF